MRVSGLVGRWGIGLAGLSLMSLGLVGCGSNVRTSEPTTGDGGGGTTGGVAGAAIAGVVRGAARPVVGASVMLYGAGSTGNGMGAEALLGAALATGADGSFAVPAGFRCASSEQELYAVARGGTDQVLRVVTALGTCGDVGSTTTPYVLNEATTVAAAWALRPFLALDGDGTVEVGATATNGTGLAHAVAMAQALAGVTTGTAPGSGVAGTVTVPVAKVNTLASLLAVCAADAGSAPGLRPANAAEW